MLNLLKPPVFDDHKQTQAAYQLHIILWSALVATTSAASLLILLVPENAPRWWLLMGAIDGSSILLLMLNRWGYIRWAKSVLVLTAWVVATAFALSGGGTRAPAAMTGYLVVVLIAGLLAQNWRAGAVVALLCIATDLGLVYLELTERLPLSQANPTPLSRWATTVLFILIGVGLQYLTASTLRASLRRVQVELAERQHIEKNLRASERRFRAFMETSPAIVILKDAAGRYVYCNSQVEQLFGLPATAILGQTEFDLFPPAEAARFTASDQQVLTSGQPLIQEYAAPTPQGKLHDWWIFKFLIPNLDGQDYLGLHILDITERKQAEERHRLIASVISDYAFSERFGPQGELLAMTLDGAVEAITGYAPEEFQALGWQGILYPADRAQDARDLERLNANQKVITEVRIIKKNGDLRWVRAYVNPLWDAVAHQLTGVYGVVQDITARKQAEAALAEQAAETMALYQASARLASSALYDLRALAQQVTDIAIQDFGCHHSHLWLLRADGLALIGLVFSGAGRADVPDMPLAGPGLIVAAVRSGAPIYVPDVRLDARYVPGFAETRTEFVIPLQARGGLLGIFNLEHPAVDAFKERTQRALMAFAERAALVIENSQLYQAAQAELAERQRAEVALRESEALYRRAIEAAAAVPYYIDHATKTYRFMGAGIEPLTGYAPTEMTLSLWRSLVEEVQILGEAARFSREEADRLAHAGLLTIWSADNRIRTRSGPIRWVNNSSVEVLGEQGTSIGAIGILQDITQRKQAEDSIRQYADVVTNMQVGLYIFEAEDEAAAILRIIAANPAALQFSDVREAEIVGTLLDDSFPALRAKGLPQKYAEVIQTGLPQELEDEYFNATGRLETAYAIKAFPLPHRRVGVAFEDVTRRKQAEEALQHLNTQLEQRVLERTAELQLANAHLAKAARLKDEFLASMSHELRTPLTAILAFAQLLQKPVYGALNEKQLKAVKTIDDSGKHLLELITDILDLSKIEAGKLELEMEWVSVEAVCQASLRLVRQMAANKHQTVEYRLLALDLRLNADARRLKQMLVNLLSNAIKFTPEGGALGLEVGGDPARPAVYFTVWDKGIGIAPHDVSRLFQAFVQLDARLSREYSGTGLGLALVRRMAELHGGSVSVESDLGQGSRFTLTLPWHNAPSAPPAAAPHPTLPVDQPARAADLSPLPSQRPLILLAEDSPVMAQVLSDYLEVSGYEVQVARAGQEAVQRARVIPYALLLMDVQMPGLNGLEAMRLIRQAPTSASLPIIALTALAMPGDRERCLAAGANEYLTKPVNLDLLAEKIRALLKSA